MAAYRRITAFRLLGIIMVMVALPLRGVAQQSEFSDASPIIEFPNLGPVPGGGESNLGPAPGTLSTPFEPGSATAGTSVGAGRRRSGRLPRTRTAAQPATKAHGMQLPEPIAPPPPIESMASAAVDLESMIVDDEGPADGLSLDAMLEQMMVSNLDIRALRHELSQADADVLTAGLRTNPLIYMDTQFIPYGSFTDARPGGPTQYDLNITYPLDVSQKRQARTVVARMAKSTIEAQFQDVVRRQVDNASRAFVTLQATRLDLLTMQAAVRRRELFLARMQQSARPDDAAAMDAIERTVLLLERSREALGDAEEAFEDAQEGVAILLNVPPEETSFLQPRGSLRDTSPPPPELDELAAIAIRCRPDIHAARLGVTRAGAEVRLQRANRFDDVYLFYDPITYQDNRPTGQMSSHSWAIGLTFALPIYNRNQGNIARAESNVSQTKLELSSLERRIVSEVRLALREYERSREALEHLERAIVPRMADVLQRKRDQLEAGTLSMDDFDVTLDDALEVGQQHRDTLVRHRRSMVELNTAVGLRILP